MIGALGASGRILFSFSKAGRGTKARNLLIEYELDVQICHIWQPAKA